MLLFSWGSTIVVVIEMAVAVSKFVKSYFAETSLHGLKYITEDDRHPVERILWVILFCLGVAMEISFMLPGTEISYQVAPQAVL